MNLEIALQGKVEFCSCSRQKLVSTKRLEYLEIIYFWDGLFGKEMYCIVYHCKVCFFLFVTIASCMYCHYEVVESGKKCAQFGSTDQSTVVLIEIIVWDAVLIWLNGGHVVFLPMHFVL